MIRVYLDNCCFNRPYDDLSSETVRLEAEAKILIQSLVLNDSIEIVWSFILSLENDENPNIENKDEISNWRAKSYIDVPAAHEVEARAQKFEILGIKPKDAAHLSYALEANAQYFITTDRKLIRKTKDLDNEIEIINPLDFIAILEGKYEK